MEQTARYCCKCLLALTPDDAVTPEDHLLLKVLGYTKGRYPNYGYPHVIETDTCVKCDKRQVVISYSYKLADLHEGHSGKDLI